jgi:glycosyltransferase involved in cell wall biosynthesis
MGGERVEFVERPGREALRDLVRRARAVVNPGVEDFGMGMAEAQACGTPVIALRAGGAREIVTDGRTGVLYDDPSPTALARVMRSFQSSSFSPHEARNGAERFSAERFDEGIRRVVDEVAS